MMPDSRDPQSDGVENAVGVAEEQLVSSPSLQLLVDFGVVRIRIPDILL